MKLPIRQLATMATLALTFPATAQSLVRCWGDNTYGQCNVPGDLGPVVAVAAGLHTVAITASGAVRCWGDNRDGQCNVPPDLGVAAAVAAGYVNTAVLTASGTVRCWGRNWNGECNVPADLNGVTNVAMGAAHGVALTSSGTIRCWGSNGFGQGNVPADLGAACAVAAGAAHTVALAKSGFVRCWGRNSEGQCNVPGNLGFASSIAAGDIHSVALSTNGAVRCWGSNQYGQCEIPNDLGAVAAVSSGDNVVIALTTAGTVRCWGRNDYGQCVAPIDLGVASLVSVGTFHAVALAGSPLPDGDNDGRPDSTDNCPTIANPTQADCNTDGIGDVCEIAAGAPDFNQDTIPDTCQCGTIPSLPACCLGDLDHDGEVGGADIGLLLSNWGPCGSACLYDLNNDDKVNGGDLGLLLSGWGPCPATVIVPSWATLVEAMPDPAVVTDATLRAAITASGMAWRVRDTATQMEMLLVPPGTFTMGCTASNQSGCDTNENPTHSVTLTQAFYLGRYEVTQGQWVAKMGSNPSYFAGQSDSSSRPVERVSWFTVQYGYLSATGMRLPSEAEWEYACRAGTTTAFNNGSSDDATVENIAWYNGNSGNQTHAVGGKAANALGLYDMSGNVWEWVNDWYRSTYYSVSPSTNPLGPGSGAFNVLRGGSWYFGASAVRSSARGSYDGPLDNAGFRVARNP